MFKKILIANRGEIACRVIRTARAMGIATVAVYSDADARSPHVMLADESVRLGPAPAAESYLKAELILLAARETGADAIHPGYGFLSERESFARACAEAGIAFIGPPPNAIAAMGDKIESKKLAKQAGVNVVPGFLGEIADTEHAVRIAGEIGYPVMMKASAGGGGKGMRLAWSEADVREGFEATKREGLASFGDDRVFIEKFIQDPRHIEIQVLGDQHGKVLYLGERECSVQRRHQKVVEEAPSPFVTPAMRRAMGEQAVALARAVGYYSAGTVELIVSGADPTGESFYFLEMNTRLQVEHPVTEEITGLDLVEQMIRVAAGEPLSIEQDDVRLNGWSVETRVYAEDPYRGFLPSIGRLVRYQAPEPVADEAGRVRVDDGVAEGGEVSMFYDPMIAKLVTWAPTREGAIDAQVAALDGFRIEGPGTNLDFLSALMQHPRFRDGALTTGFIAEEYPEGFHGAPAEPELLRILAAVAAFVATAEADRARRIDGQLGRRLPPPGEWQVRIGGEDRHVVVDTDAVTVDGVGVELEMEYTPGDRIVTVEAPEALTIRLARTRGGWRLSTRGAAHEVRVVPGHAGALTRHMIEKVAPDLSRFLIAPMPGLLVRLDVGEGDRVEAGQALAVVEAMKMENILRAAKSGTVKAVSARTGDSLAVDAVILELE
ncbi:acetyl/propionyl/methylcrotonyl-CoA carboxylase subunit alpha [Sphingomonas carotinifaciens]|uniref:propionyl-CoA carboxylase n=1 Tax=Sphingomonas carotinifaciens TaxID=1166323 RepID=A0A1G7G1U0_9SPHN|nr:acetyl/propionyl/methylcrotonyl-CoA carboxylase subunit alpha [Sphingomonas carotinifaciens]MBB4086341.1 propionyl-CoA carboxylase alpha chain [Sphingomonas carotinifaciens]MWC42661.1 biotin/lipoyl-binding protein [Sphingomonas carotinifaciens]SDE82107.1 propionyl-CoA carboxylase alpha chain [Sphingomonas carotinifaciens]